MPWMTRNQDLIRMFWLRGRNPLVGLFALAASWVVVADIPATPVMTLYRFNGDLNLPYYDVDKFHSAGAAAAPVGRLVQGTTLIPCLAIRGGRQDHPMQSLESPALIHKVTSQPVQ